MPEQYVSPLMFRLKKSGSSQGNAAEKITLEGLAIHVPKIHLATEAEEVLKSNPELPFAERRKLDRMIYEGAESKEYLILLAIPLIKTLAIVEHRRREAWGTRVTVEDLVSEGIVGFLKGLNKYNPDGNHKSATNYLGQWIISAMKRNVEELDHDFSVPYETIERWRKIRAIRSRLSNELGRDPSDQEIVDEANNPQIYGDQMLGRVEKREATSASAARRKLQVRHIEEERENASRTGVFLGEEYGQGTDEDSAGSTIDTSGAYDVTKDEYGSREATIEGVERKSAEEALQEVIRKTLDRMRIASTQADIIRRKYGLEPYDEPQKLKDISTETSVPKHKVTKIVEEFSKALTTPHSEFHEIVASMSHDERESVNLSYVVRTLGTFDITQRTPMKKDLLVDISTTSTLVPETRSALGFVATFKCSKDGGMITRHYRNEEETPNVIRCSHCNSASPRVFSA